MGYCRSICKLAKWRMAIVGRAKQRQVGHRAARLAKMFVNNATASVASDSTTSSASTRSGISFDQKDGVQHDGLHGVGPVQPRQGEHSR